MTTEQHYEWCDLGNRISSLRAAQALARKWARRGHDRVKYEARQAPNDWRWAIFAWLPMDAQDE